MLTSSVYKFNKEDMMESVIVDTIQWMLNNAGVVNTIALRHIISGNWFSYNDIKEALEVCDKIIKYQELLMDNYMFLNFDGAKLLIEAKLAMIIKWKEVIGRFNKRVEEQVPIMRV